jgi:hypothetical protein
VGPCQGATRADSTAYLPALLSWFCFPSPGIIISTNADEACKGVDVAVMVGGFPRKAGMERKDVMSKNVSIYASQAAALEKHANKGVKVCRAAYFCFSHESICKQLSAYACVCRMYMHTAQLCPANA